MSQAETIYEAHHKARRAPGFSILKDDRGAFIREAVGTGKRILDIGCRDGALTRTFMEGNTVTGVDVDREALARAGELGIEAIQMDLLGDWEELGDRQFDAVVAGEILEHLYFPEQVVCKIRSRLKEDGVLVGSVPNAFSLKNRLRYLRGTKKHTPLSDPTHINQFSAPELEALLARHFREVTVTGLGRYTRLAKLSPNFFAFDLAFVARP
ncbi:MAG TPA: methyltransferase domain-containing protein [Candidatus Paceibacterota bacterium]|nr:methyltransferase domain-containing protein [Candidatus Paceibacterota bacterium]